MRRIRYLLIPFLVLTWSVMPILGLQSSSRNISSYGTVKYPEHQLGVWDILSGSAIPGEADWIMTRSPDYGSINLLQNPGFEHDFSNWRLYTPSGKTPLLLDMLPEYVGKSAVMVSDELGYRGGLRQSLWNVPPNTTFHFKAVIKTVDIEVLDATILYRDVYDAEGNWYGGDAGKILGSKDWALYETSFTTPSVITDISVFPALVYNKGEVWIDEVSLIQEGGVPPTTPAILNWFNLFPYPKEPFRSESEMKRVEGWLKTVQAENFWGILSPGREEIYRTDIAFNDEVNTTWFGERLIGYPLYLAESPSATVDDWKDEMYLRMIRGFYNYFSPLTKVGITWGCAWDFPGVWDIRYGEPAIRFIKQHYDFLILYPYTENLDKWLTRSKPYLSAIEDLFPNQKKFWILTRIWDYNRPRWKLEAIALELKNCFDRKIPVLSYHRTEPPFEEVWTLMLKAIELYDSKAPYYENSVYGRNLLTGYVGDTYGWVEVLE